ncbi:MAG: PhoH family protein [Desulfomonile tiedjei]|nr:PhoH family protein [Desulfomonile tiedjei]
MRTPTAQQGEKSSRKVSFDNIGAFQALVGELSKNIKYIEKSLGVSISIKGNTVSITGDPPGDDVAERLLKQLYPLARDGYPIHPVDIDQGVRMLRNNSEAKIRDLLLHTVFTSPGKRPITPKTPQQKKYIEAIQTHDIVFGIGPAGTGKTYLAMAMAMASFAKKELRRIILTRPAVEAGEKLGFLPGDLYEKVNPYLRPLYDALHDMIDFEKASRMIERGDIEVAPLAFMRGRTLNDSFVILDEAQNTTSEQMKMFLTRLGYSSKALITGDITQIDLPDDTMSGLVEAREILSDIEGIEVVMFTEQDVVRHPLVQEIIKAYESKSFSRERRMRR